MTVGFCLQLEWVLRVQREVGIGVSEACNLLLLQKSCLTDRQHKVGFNRCNQWRGSWCKGWQEWRTTLLCWHVTESKLATICHTTQRQLVTMCHECQKTIASGVWAGGLHDTLHIEQFLPVSRDLFPVPQNWKQVLQFFAVNYWHAIYAIANVLHRKADVLDS